MSLTRITAASCDDRAAKCLIKCSNWLRCAAEVVMPGDMAGAAAGAAAPPNAATAVSAKHK